MTERDVKEVVWVFGGKEAGIEPKVFNWSPFLLFKIDHQKNFSFFRFSPLLYIHNPQIPVFHPPYTHFGCRGRPLKEGLKREHDRQPHESILKSCRKSAVDDRCSLDGRPSTQKKTHTRLAASPVNPLRWLRNWG